VPTEIVYLLWSNKHQAWWAPRDLGYTLDIDAAGRYSELNAIDRVVTSAHSGKLENVTCMVAAPDNWTGAQPAPAPMAAVVSWIDPATGQLMNQRLEWRGLHAGGWVELHPAELADPTIVALNVQKGDPDADRG
jgi:hypothetical protein